MSDERNARDSFVKGFLIGGFVGALAGLLFAPKSGKELRSDIRKKSEEAMDETKRFYADTKEKAGAILADAIHRAEQLKQEAAHQLAEARQKAEEILSRAGEKTSAVGESAKEFIEDAKSGVMKKKEKITKAVEAGVVAAKDELSKR
jgi:gas vesicle protein